MDLFWKVSSRAKQILTQKEEAMASQEDKTENSMDFAAGLGSEKPVSSLSLETQQGNSDREASSESEGHESEQSASPVSKESERTYEASEEEKSNAKAGISTGDLKDVSQKAVEQAKSIGSFLYGITKKTGRTLSETAKHLKTTVEENSILGDFNKEQEAFVSSKTTKSEDDSTLPWVGSEDEESVKQQIFSLSADRRNFLRSPPTGVMFDFSFDKMYPIAEKLLKEDPALEKMRFEIVPKLINEENFWRNYFYRVSLVQQSSRRTLASRPKGSSGDTSGASTDKSSSDESIKDMRKTAGGHEDTDSPNHEFVSDAFQSNRVTEEDIKQGMKLLGVTGKVSREEDWEKEIQQELQEYEVVNDGNDDDQEWENEIEDMLGEKVKDIV